MKKLLMFLLITAACSASAQKITKTGRASRYSTHVWGDGFEGVIFKKNFEPFKSDSLGRIKFTPDPADIEMAERLLRAKLDTAKGHDSDNGDTVAPDLNRYVRQYCGYYNSKREKIIFINCFRNARIYRDRKYWYKYMVRVWDGGNRFWCVALNLSTGQLFDLYINGV